MATYYWVGGTGTWDASSTTNWSATSGGAGGAGVPNNTDTVIFDSASGTGTCTTASGSACATATLNSSTLGLTLGANHSMSGNFTLTLGTLSLGSNKLTCNIFSSSNANIRTIDFGTGDITVTGNAATVITLATGTNAVFAGTPTFNCTYAGATGTRTINISSVITNTANINITAGTDIVTLGSSYANSVNFTGFSGSWTNSAWRMTGNLTISTGMTVSAGANGVIFLGTSGTQQITTNGKTLDFPITQNSPGATLQLQDNLTMGSTRTFTLTAGTLDLVSRTLSTGLFSSSNSNTRSIAFGTGNITLTGNAATIFSASTATNLTITGTPVVNCTYSGGTGSRQINGGSAAVLGEAQSISFNVTAGTDTIVLGSGNAIKNIDFTGFSGTINASSATSVPIYGDFKLSATCTPSFAVGTTLNFAATSGTKTITCAGTTIGANIAFTGLGGTWEFADALTLASPRTINFTNGTLRLKSGVTSTVYGFTSSGIVQKNLQSTTLGVQAVLSDPSGTVSTNYLTIRDINATGGATWNAFVDQFNVDAGNNDGWDFGISPIVGGNEYTYQLRSFTQPRRF